MYLKALEIQGFKSFPDKTVLNFGEDITAIVGPNGSGKSNISDAIRWVMGEQSSKSLRGVKMEDVIFGGTETRNQMGFAQVTLVLDNTEHIFPSMEETEVAVTRRYYRSGESEYYINKQSVRLRDVNELFMDTGMGREGYSIIGQGRIDEILSQKSGDRREIFEEAAGISRFRYRKEETERKLERTEENLVRINDKIAELELQVEPLRAQAETAKQYLIYRDELRLLEISVWLENLETLKTNAIKLDTDLSLAREELKKANADLEALYAASEQFSARIHENDIAQEEKRAQLSELDAQVKEQESAVAVLQTGIAHNEENIARVEEELRSQSDRVGSMDAQIAQQRARIEELERSKNEVETALSSLLKQAEELSKNAGEAASEAETLRGREALALTADLGWIDRQGVSKNVYNRVQACEYLQRRIARTLLEKLGTLGLAASKADDPYTADLMAKDLVAWFEERLRSREPLTDHVRNLQQSLLKSTVAAANVKDKPSSGSGSAFALFDGSGSRADGGGWPGNAALRHSGKGFGLKLLLVPEPEWCYPQVMTADIQQAVHRAQIIRRAEGELVFRHIQRITFRRQGGGKADHQAVIRHKTGGGKSHFHITPKARHGMLHGRTGPLRCDPCGTAEHKIHCFPAFQYTLPSSPPYRRLDGCSIPLLVQKFADLGFHGTHLALKCAGGYP